MSSQSDKWYAEGLRFSCNGCGRCCHGPGGYVWVGEDEIKALALELGMELDEFGSKYLRRTARGFALVDGANGDCVLLGADGRCKVYEVRPTQCRTYPWWPEVVGNVHRWEAEKKTCPGIGNGKLHPQTHIDEELSRSED